MALIGVSGKIGSGKDTVGKIIQYLTLENDERRIWNTFDKYCKDIPSHHPMNTWKVKKFAGKLKQIVSLLTGCNVDDLEFQEFKNQQVGKQWNIEHRNWISEPEVKKYAEHEGKTLEEYLAEGNHELIYSDATIKTYRFKGLDKTLTYREMLQRVGTEAMRNQIHENVWVNALFADYKCTMNGVYGDGRVVYNDDFPKWIITDMRFPNELKAVEEKYGITIRVNRPLDNVLRESLDSSRDGLRKDAKYNRDALVHPSETALDDAKFKYTIDNNGTIEELVEKVKEILILEKII